MRYFSFWPSGARSTRYNTNGASAACSFYCTCVAVAMSGPMMLARAARARECAGAGHAPGRTMGVMHVMMVHGRRAAAAAAHKLRRRDLVKVVVRHITGGSQPQEAENDVRRVFGSLTGLCRGVC